MKEVRCPECNKLLCKLIGRTEIKCPRCKYVVKAERRERHQFKRGDERGDTLS
jgi:phage FluMu protein Com